MRQHLQATALAAALLACPLGGAAQETTTIFEADMRALDLSLEPAARVRVFDNTRDGCWPDAVTSERVVERLLADAGFEILDDNAFGPTILLSAKGFMEDGRCFLSLDLGVYAFELTFLRHSEFAIQSLFPRNIFYHTRLALGSREEIGALIDVEFYNLTIGFLDDLKNNKRRIRYELEARLYTLQTRSDFGRMLPLDRESSHVEPERPLPAQRRCRLRASGKPALADWPGLPALRLH